METTEKVVASSLLHSGESEHSTAECVIQLDVVKLLRVVVLLFVFIDNLLPGGVSFPDDSAGSLSWSSGPVAGHCGPVQSNCSSSTFWTAGNVSD